MTSSAALRLCAAGLALVALGGCSDGESDALADRVIVEDLNIQGITITQPKDTIAVGEVLPLTAFDSASGADLSGNLSWASSDTSVATVATVEGAVNVTGVSDGTVTITASVGGIEGTTTLDVSSAGILSIAVSSSEVPIDVCTAASFSASGTFADGRVDDITGLADWQVSNTTLGAFDASMPGRLTTQVAGNLDVTASLTGVTSDPFPVVISDSLSAITVDAAATSIAAGATTQLTALGSFGGPTEDISENAQFASASESVATVDVTGLVTAVGAGTSVLSATCNGIAGDLTLTVTESDSTAIDLQPIGSEPFSVSLGSSLQLEVEATFEDLSTRNVTEEASWSRAPGSVGTVDVSNEAGSKGRVTPNFAGTGLVRAEYESQVVTITVQVGL